MIGEHSYTKADQDFNDRNNLEYETTVIGRYCQIAKGVVIAPGEHPSTIDRKVVSNFPFANQWGLPNYPSCNPKGKTVIGNDVLIGTNAIILSGVQIGDGAIVGAGSIVTKDVPDFAIVVGNPAKVVKYRFNKETAANLKRIAWWRWDKTTIENNLQDFLDIKEFIKKYG